MDLAEMHPAYTMSGSDLLTTLDALHTEAALRDTYRLHLLARLDEIGHAKDLGARDTTELLSMRHRLNPTDVRRDLKLALALPKYETVTAALPDPQTASTPAAPDGDRDPDREPVADGASDNDSDSDGELTSDATDLDSPPGATDLDSLPDTTDSDAADLAAGAPAPVRLHPGQAQAIVTALEKVPATVPVEDLLVAEEQMVEAARYLSPADLRILGKRVVDTLDTDGTEPAENDAYHREALWLRPADHGIKFGGYLANENAELLKTAIHALAKPHKTVDGELDPRSRDKRQADALVTILDTATTASTGPGVPHLTVTIDFTDLKAATSQATGDLVHGDNLSAAAVRRLACDAAVLPIVLGSKSQPLDVGTEQRFVTGAMRKALNKRDKGCIICQAPPPQCHAHHIIHWADGGPTSIDNLALFCGSHHTAIHHGHYTVTITNGAVHVTRPTWADPTPTRQPRPQLRPAKPTAASPTPTPPTHPTHTDPAHSDGGLDGSVRVQPAWPHANSDPRPHPDPDPPPPRGTADDARPEHPTQTRPAAIHQPLRLIATDSDVPAVQIHGDDHPPSTPPRNTQLAWLTAAAAERLDPWGERSTEPDLADSG
ncbi:HNH endonuclease signature motif containing protein [Kribbella sancticallisti]